MTAGVCINCGQQTARRHKRGDAFRCRPYVPSAAEAEAGESGPDELRRPVPPAA